MTIDWSVVTSREVMRACSLFDSGKICAHHPAKNTFLLHHGRRYPAKVIRGAAYELATGHRLNPSTDYSGGEETARHLRLLGFDVLYEAPALHRPTIRVVSVSVKGVPASSDAQSLRRLELLSQIVEGMMARDWRNVECVLLPGGFYYVSERVPGPKMRGRIRALGRCSFHKACLNACSRLADISPGIRVIAGVDSAEMDQYCVAWGPRSIVGLARKIFPTDGESAQGFRCYRDDYGSPHRVITLASGERALLCACYDMFGVTESVSESGKRTRCIAQIESFGEIVNQSDARFHRLRSDCVGSWTNLLQESAPRVALAAIHSFEQPGRDGFWQRHGIATCSAALGSGIAVGAAHFKTGLPGLKSCSLASNAVPRRHLTAGSKREAHRAQSKDGFLVGNDAVVRLFDLKRKT